MTQQHYDEKDDNSESYNFKIYAEMGKEDPVYYLKKISIEEGKISFVFPGERCTGDRLHLFDFETEEYKQIDSIEEVELGWQVIVSRILGQYIRTSKIKEIVSKTPNKVTFQTQTSLYELGIVDDADLDNE